MLIVEDILSTFVAVAGTKGKCVDCSLGEETDAVADEGLGGVHVFESILFFVIPFHMSCQLL
jgi:hypothetical protein